MPGDAKLETADELYDLFGDLERLKNYKYTQPVVSDSGIDNEKFHLELPYEDIKAVVEKCRDEFMAALPENERSGKFLVIYFFPSLVLQKQIMSYVTGYGWTPTSLPKQNFI